MKTQFANCKLDTFLISFWFDSIRRYFGKKVPYPMGGHFERFLQVNCVLLCFNTETKQTTVDRDRTLVLNHVGILVPKWNVVFSETPLSLVLLLLASFSRHYTQDLASCFLLYVRRSLTFYSRIGVLIKAFVPPVFAPRNFRRQRFC